MRRPNTERVIAYCSEWDEQWEEGTVSLFAGKEKAATFSATFAGDIGGQSIAYIGNLRTEPTRRREGLATRLISGLTCIAIGAEMDELRGSVESEHTIAIFAKLFGDRVRYYDLDPKTHQEIELPMSNEQAIQSLTLAAEHEDDLEDRDIHFSLSVLLAGLDLEAFEKPDVALL